MISTRSQSREEMVKDRNLDKGATNGFFTRKNSSARSLSGSNDLRRTFLANQYQTFRLSQFIIEVPLICRLPISKSQFVTTRNSLSTTVMVKTLLRLQKQLSPSGLIFPSTSRRQNNSSIYPTLPRKAIQHRTNQTQYITFTNRLHVPHSSFFFFQLSNCRAVPVTFLVVLDSDSSITFSLSLVFLLLTRKSLIPQLSRFITQYPSPLTLPLSLSLPSLSSF